MFDKELVKDILLQVKDVEEGRTYTQEEMEKRSLKLSR